MKKYQTTILLVGLTYISFISLGLPDGLLGVAWPSIRTFFKLPLDALGALLVMFTAGYLLSSFSSGRILARLNVGSLLALSCMATAVSLLGYALTPSWWIMVALGLLSGLGAGAIDAGLNTYAATHFSARAVNWLHACYGIGATIGPLIMTSVLMASHPWQRGYVIVGIAQLALAMCFAMTGKLWANDKRDAELAQDDLLKSTSSGSASLASPTPTSTLRLPITWLSIAVFFIYTGIEAAAGTWAYSLFTEGRGVPVMTAGTWVSVYWGCLTAGRLLSGFVINFVPVRLLLRYCIFGIALGAGMIWLNVTSFVSFVGLALMGLSSAPIFPSMIATTPERLGAAHTANVVGFQIAAAVLGQSLLPSFIGVLADNFGLEIVAPILLMTAMLLLAIYETLTATSPKMVREVQAMA
ncbi:MFS transporter [candidate division KSB1 bacterium]|nr:MFS transporter [candidate division KSB1 bacterium]